MSNQNATHALLASLSLLMFGSPRVRKYWDDQTVLLGRSINKIGAGAGDDETSQNVHLSVSGRENVC